MPENAAATELPYEILNAYSDVNFWIAPKWDVTENTVMGNITKATGVALDFHIPAQDGDRQLSLMLLNDELPDIISVTDENIIGQLVSSGKVWNLEELLTTYCPDSHLLTAFPEDVKAELIRRDGGWYAYPSHMNSIDAAEIWKPNDEFYVEYKKYSYNNGILWNRRILERLGLDVEDLKTEEQVLDAFHMVQDSQLQVNGSDVIPVLLDGVDYQTSSLKYLEDSFGAEYIDEIGNYKDINLQPQTRHVFQFVNQLFRNHYMTPDQLTLDNEHVKRKLASGRVFCFIGNIANTAVNPTEWVSSGAIRSSTGEKSVEGISVHKNTGWISTFVARDCPHPELAARWIDYMTSEEGMRLACYGIENEDYILDEEGCLIQTEKGKKRKNNYRETGVYAWWMFHNFAWENSVLKAPEAGSPEYQNSEFFMAFGKDENTVVYDCSALVISGSELDPDEKYVKLDKSINEYVKKRIPVLLLADNEDTFDREYWNFYSQLAKLGVQSLNEKKNEIMKENCERYGITMEKINRENKDEKN